MCATSVDYRNFATSWGFCDMSKCPKKGDSLWKLDNQSTITTHFENDVDIRYTITKEGEAKPVYPDIVRVNSSGPAAELYPDSLGDYRRLPDITHNDLPVFKHTVRDDRFIISVGNHNIIFADK